MYTIIRHNQAIPLDATFLGWATNRHGEWHGIFKGQFTHNIPLKMLPPETMRQLPPCPMRMWAIATGGEPCLVEAVSLGIVESQGEACVMLRRSIGTTLYVPLQRLSEADKRYLQEYHA